jgi:hypothetical protein
VDDASVANPDHHAHKSSHFHSDPLGLWNSYGYMAAHLYLVGSAGYLVIDQISDFSEGLSDSDALLLQTLQNLFLAAIFVVDAIFYYKGSMFAPWKWQPGTSFHILSPETHAAIRRWLPCYKPTKPRPPASKKVADRSIEQHESSLNLPTETESNENTSSITSSNPLDVSTPASRSNTSSHPTSTPCQVTINHASAAVVLSPITYVKPIAPEDDLGYFFPLCVGSLGEGFNILASVICFLAALHAFLPISDANLNIGAYTSQQHAADVATMAIWTASAVFYHRDWQLNYSNQSWWFRSLDGTASMCNVGASALYLYACSLAAYMGRVVPAEWRFLQGGSYLDFKPTPLTNFPQYNGTPSAISSSNIASGWSSTGLANIASRSLSAELSSSGMDSSVDLESDVVIDPWMSHLWQHMNWCGLVADCLYLLSAILYEGSDLRHQWRAKALMAADAQRCATPRYEQARERRTIIDAADSIASISADPFDSSTQMSRRSSESDASADDDLIGPTVRTRQLGLQPVHLRPSMLTSATHHNCGHVRSSTSLSVDTVTGLAVTPLHTRRGTNRVIQVAAAVSSSSPASTARSSPASPSVDAYRDILSSLSSPLASSVALTSRSSMKAIRSLSTSRRARPPHHASRATTYDQYARQGNTRTGHAHDVARIHPTPLRAATRAPSEAPPISSPISVRMHAKSDTR